MAPRLEERPATAYAAIAGSGCGERELRTFADGSFPAIFRWLGAQGVQPAAPPFLRFFRFRPGDEFEVEVGVPITTLLESGDERVRIAELPAGRYAVYVHEGAYSADDDRWASRDLGSAHRILDAWAEDRELTWARTSTDSRDAWSVSIEQYLIGPADTSDPNDWRTEIAKLIA